MPKAFEKRLLSGMRETLLHILDTLEIPLVFYLWDGSRVAGRKTPGPEYSLTIDDRGVIASLLKRPTPENLLRHYATGNIGLDGGDLISIGEAVRENLKKQDLKKISKKLLLRRLWPFLFVGAKSATMQHAYAGPESKQDSPAGEHEARENTTRENRDYIQFH
jgi:cyclopropane-fatty-acyl-phospholipid synthase